MFEQLIVVAFAVYGMHRIWFFTGGPQQHIRTWLETYDVQPDMPEFNSRGLFLPPFIDVGMWLIAHALRCRFCVLFHLSWISGVAWAAGGIPVLFVFAILGLSHIFLIHSGGFDDPDQPTDAGTTSPTGAYLRGDDSAESSEDDYPAHGGDS